MAHGYFGRMPRAEIASKQAIFTLSQLHAELAGFWTTRERPSKIRMAMMQVEADFIPVRGKNCPTGHHVFKCCFAAGVVLGTI
jgi:hypothetical protein